jgi:hypothetical protein
VVAAVALLAGWAVAANTAPALAATAVWHVTQESFPTELAPGGTGRLELRVTNVSETPSTGAVTAIVTLPPGVTATQAGTVDDIVGDINPSSFWSCTGSHVVTCTATPAGGILQDDFHGEVFSTVPAGNAPPIGIRVSVPTELTGPMTTTVEVNGGGASHATTFTGPLTAGPGAAPAGLRDFALAILNKDGSPAAQAGSHPYEMTTSFTVNNAFNARGEPRPVADPRDIEVQLPTGLIGNAQVVAQCSRAEFDAGINEEGLPDCPADTQVGTEIFALLTSDIRLEMPVYNLTHPRNVPAEFGFGDLHHRAIIAAGIRTGEGYGLKVNLGSIEKIGFISSRLTIWGEPADPSHDPDRCAKEKNRRPECDLTTTLPRMPLLTLPAACGAPLSEILKLNFWQDPSVVQEYRASATDEHGNPLAVTGCEDLGFEPSVSIRPDVAAADSPSGLNVDLRMPDREAAGLAESTLSDASVSFPAGLTVNSAAADGLVGCTPEQIGLSGAGVPSCPDASKIGLARIETPLLAKPLEGAVYLAQPYVNPFGSLLAVYLVVEAEGGIIVKTAGHVTANAVTGQLTATFDESPSVPFSDVHLELFNDQRAAFATPMACGSYTTESHFLGYSGALASFSEPFQITSKCGGGFAPSFAAGMTDTRQAGGFSRFSLRFARSDEDQLLGGIQVHAPPGLLGMLSSVPLCGEPQASQGLCGPESLIGHTTVGVGAGEKPFYIRAGQVFLTGPYRGAPFGLSIVVPAVAGPFNLGTVVVRASISVDPHTSQLTITSDPLPQIVQGIPILLRSVEVNVDRPSFMFNPTSCDASSIGATISSPLGASAPVSTPFQVSNCAGLAFKPAFVASTAGKTSRAAGASLDVKLGFPGAPFGSEANIAKVKVDLPKQLPSRLTTLQKACVDTTFNQNPGQCPAGSIVGIAKASTPILPVTLSGPAYFVSHGGAKFPELIVVLQGDGVRVDLAGETFISKAGITSSTFATVPDVPVSSFELYLPEGPHSALAANGNLCKSKLVMPTAFTAQNGAVIRQSTKVTVTGCPKARAARKARKARRAGGARRARAAAAVRSAGDLHIHGGSK